VQRDRLVGRLACGVGAEASLGQLSVPLGRGTGILADVVLDRRARVVSADSSPAPAVGGGEASILSTSSLVATPLVVRDQCVGVLIATRPADRVITATDQSLAELLCNQAAVALHHVTG
jgi:GAF domain-containing protein